MRLYRHFVLNGACFVGASATAADPEVKPALAELARASRASVKLGPSDAFRAGARMLDQAERQLLGKPTTSPAKKGKAKRARGRS